MFDTVTLTAADVVVLPEASRARAVSECGPLMLFQEFQTTAYGALVSSAPSGSPSTRNWTPATASLSDALAVTFTVVPDTVEPAVGAVTATVGSVVSQADVVAVRVALVDALLAKSYASTETS